MSAVSEPGHPFVGDGARIVGAVSLGVGSSVWFNAVLRGDGDTISVGDRSNVQDGVILHTDPGFPVSIGADVSIGHNAIVHGATIGDGCLIGIGSVVLNGAVIGAGSLIAAGAVIPERMQVPASSLVTGVPGVVRRSLTATERDDLVANARRYVQLADSQKSGLAKEQQ